MRNDLSRQEDQEGLYDLLAHRVQLYLGIENSSLPKEAALELFRSVAFTLGQCPPMGDLNAQFEAGLKVTEQKVAYGKQLWQMVNSTLPRVENRSLLDTVRGMNGFWRRYDHRFFAHQIPCDVDYQLCQAVPAELEGIDFINRYLGHLAVENDFLNRFDPRRAAELLETYCGDYRGLLINLFEPVATNALGLALVGGDVAMLHITGEQREQIKATDPARLRDAADRLCGILDIETQAARAYLKALADSLVPRIRQTSLEGIFLSLRSCPPGADGGHPRTPC